MGVVEAEPANLAVLRHVVVRLVLPARRSALVQVAPDDTLARVPREAARPGARLLVRALRKMHGRGAVRAHTTIRRLAAVLRLQRHVRPRERLAKSRRVLYPLLVGIGLWVC